MKLKILANGLKGVLAITTISAQASGAGGVSAKVHEWSERHSHLQFEHTTLPLVSYRPSGRDATITTAQRVLAKLLQSSQLSDAHVPVETICQSPEDCRNVYGLPRQQGLERWQEGFVVDELVTLQSRLSASEAIVTTDDLRIRKAEDGLLVSRPGVFSLRLFESGDTFRIVNELNGYHKYDNGEGYYDEMEAEALGRELIEELKLVSLAETEELVLLKTNYVRFTGNDASPGDRVVSTQVTFGRTIGGTPILGKSGRSEPHRKL